MSPIQKPLPKPNVDLSHADETSEWTEGKVRAFFCNPVYAGIGPYPRLVDDETWVRAAAKAMQQDGTEQWLVNLLYALRSSLRQANTGG